MRYDKDTRLSRVQKVHFHRAHNPEKLNAPGTIHHPLPMMTIVVVACPLLCELWPPDSASQISLALAASLGNYRVTIPGTKDNHLGGLVVEEAASARVWEGSVAAAEDLAG